MFKIYSAAAVKKILDKVTSEYENALTAQRRRITDLTAENRELLARVSLLESERGQVATALIDAERTGGEIRASADAYAKTCKDGVYRLAERCHALAEELLKKYPEEGQVKEFTRYLERLDEALQTGGEGELNMDEILYPDKNINLESLCKELGLIDEER